MPDGLGLWAGFLDRLPAGEATEAVRVIESIGISTIWLQEYGGADPFVRSTLYLQATERLSVAVGVATIHARDPDAMVAAASALHEAFPGRFVLGLGVSHRHLANARGSTYTRPLSTMREYLAAMDATAGRRTLPPRFLGALGPRMLELAAHASQGLHTYFSPVHHTEVARSAVGSGPWIAPSQMVAINATDLGWREGVRPYLGLCLRMPNYQRNLYRLGFSEQDVESASDRLVDALVVSDCPTALAERLNAQRAASANHIVIQFVPPPPAAVVLNRIAEGLVPDRLF
jgi:probable F420-dependent oxidoreductase